MSSPSDPGEYTDWKVIYDGQESTEEKPAEKHGSLAQELSVPKSMCILSDTKTDLSTVTELASPRLKLPQLSNDTSERVFPVRSVVSFDSNPSSALQTPSLDKLESPISPFADTVRATGLAEVPIANSQRRSSTPSNNDRPSVPKKRPDHLSRMHQRNQKTSSVSPSLSTVPTLRHPITASGHSLSSLKESWELRSLSEQLQHTIEEGGRVLSANRPTRGLQFTREDEADIPIQSFGALLAISDSEGNMAVQVVSSNSTEVLGHTPDELLGLESICNILPEREKASFLSHAEFVLKDDYNFEALGPEVFSLSSFTSEGEARSFWCTMHTSNIFKDYIICELEPVYLAGSPGTGNVHMSKEESISRPALTSDQSDEAHSINLPLSDAPGIRKEAVGSELLNTLPLILRKVSRTQTLEALVQSAISTLQQLTQFHRITMYHFDSDRNGVVIADETDPSLGLDSYEGFHFEESAFPDGLKKEYLRSTVSFSYRGRDSLPKLMYRASTNRQALDLSHCYLTATSSPSQELAAPSVQACLSVGIYVFGKLWGLISCHSYDESLRLHPLVQRVCWVISEAVSSNMERLSYTLPFQLQGQGDSKDERPLTRSINTPAGDLLGLFGADYAAASILGETKLLGNLADSQEVLALLEYLRAKALDAVLWSTDIDSDFDDLDYSPGFRHLSGLLYIPLSVDGHDFIIFFRGAPSTSQTGDGSGNEQTATPGQQVSPNTLCRRTEWSAAEFGKASILALLYRTFTEIWKEKEAAMQNNQLMRLLLANSAHEFRTPLNAIINYLEIALDGNLNQETRENISRSHSASKSLVYIINDLLDLTNAENGQNLIKDEIFNLTETLSEATDIFWEEARQKNVDLQVVQHSALPSVLGDQRRMRQVITNVISNAVQHTPSGAVTIESCLIPAMSEPGNIAVEVAIHDTGRGMSQETVETLFCELEQVSNKGYMRNPYSYEKVSDRPTPETKRVLGLGLALVARIVRNMNGQLSLKSEEGKGSCFKLRLKFPLPNEGDAHSEAQVPPPHECRPFDTAEPDPTKSSEVPSSEAARNVEKENSISCRCGDEISPQCGLRPAENSYINIDVALKSGISHRKIIPGSTTPRDEESKPKDTYAYNQAAAFSPDKTGKLDAEEVESKRGKLRVLIAEDDPINSTIVKKRLEKLGYSVKMTANGKECAAAYQESPTSFDAVLMDLQMPIVDGSSATKMIRNYEVQVSKRDPTLERNPHCAHIPVFAVSASLMEKDRQTYIDCGLDGWIMKPIDFQRTDVLLEGVKSAEMRNKCIYKPGMWEIGGWFDGCGVT